MTDSEKAALERRIDELCAEVERLHADQAHWELGNCPNCPNVASLQEALEQNAKLRELVLDAWGNGHPDRSCGDCDIRDECHNDMERLRKDGMMRFSRCLFELRIEDRMREMGVEVDE